MRVKTPDSIVKAEQQLERLLDLIVLHYLVEGTPISSDALVSQYKLKFSSATVRNKMRELEKRNLIVSPHNYAGRLPTAKGLQGYIAKLQDNMLDDDEGAWQNIAFSLDKLSASKLAKSAAVVVAKIVQGCAFVTLPAIDEAKVHKLEFVHLSSSRGLAVIITTTGEVRDKLIEIPKDLTVADLQRATQFFNANFSGKTLQAARDEIINRMPHLQDRITKMLREIVCQDFVRERKVTIHLHGERQLVNNPHLQTNSLRELIDLLQQKELLLRLLDCRQSNEGLEISFGEQSGLVALKGCVIITAPYEQGTLGLIGPMRMRYDHVVPLVANTAKLMTTKLAEIRLSLI